MTYPDIIFLVLDTQRADRLGCYGHTKAVTPHLDRFAEEAVLFKQAVSPAQWTIPSHASMFTGLYPTAHQVTQSHQSLGTDRPHLVEVIRGSGYETIGFCNNPLVGILNNGFKRGFDTFYNYGGAIPSLPESSSRLPWPFNQILTSYTQLLRRISYPIQNYFARSDLAFAISLNAWLTPLWSRFANFKGQNERSIRDVSYFLERREKKEGKRPLFLFINLMETHLPFWPPTDFIDKTAPYMQHDREARQIMRTWNREAYRWASPLVKPLPEKEAQVLSDLYDAEVAYQDHYLGQLFSFLEQRKNKDNTLTIIAGDHGDGLGEHGYMGHAFVAYQELVHVPLIAHWPRRFKPAQIDSPVSTRRVYHTMLDAISPLPEKIMNLEPAEIRNLSLAETINGRDPEQNTAYSEIYPPINFVRAIERRQPELIKQFRCNSMRRAIVQDNLKLIRLDEDVDELFNLHTDPLELHDQKENLPQETNELNEKLKRMVGLVKAQRDNIASGSTIDLEGNELLRQQLKGLGYLD